MAFNDDPLLEAEADKIGLQAANHHMAAQAETPPTVIPGQTGTSVTPGVMTASSSGRVVQRQVKIGGKKAQTYANFAKFKAKGPYKRLISPLYERYGEERADFHLKQLFSGEWDFVNEQHFVEALEYDIRTKSLRREEHTLQEQYMTKYGWTERAKRAALGGPSANAGGAGAGPGAVEQGPQLKVYRTMEWDQWEQLERGDYTVLRGGHLGDFKQAHDYLYRDPASGPKALVEFTLKRGAEQELFSSRAMAFPEDPNEVLARIMNTLTKEGRGDSFGRASQSEGMAPDLVGMKAEHGEAGFSLGIGGGTSPTVFQGMVEEVSVVGTRNVPSPGGSGAPPQEPEESAAS